MTELLKVPNQDFYFKAAGEYRELCGEDVVLTFLLEPCARNTAAAAAAAALHRAETHSDVVTLVLPAEYLIADQAAFSAEIAQAVELAKEGLLITFGIQPSAPETGYGYIEADGYQVKHFVAKPSLGTAKSYLQSGHFDWNTGMFCFAVQTMLDEMQVHSPAIVNQVRSSLARSRTARGDNTLQRELGPTIFAHLPEDSMDCALTENTTRAAMVSCDTGRSDIGSWTALGERSDTDSQGNRIEGEALFKDEKNCYGRSGDRHSGPVGVKDRIIVDTPDALLVAHKGRAQDVKHLCDELKPWGSKPTASTARFIALGSPTPSWRRATATRSSVSWSNPAPAFPCKFTTIAANTGSSCVAWPGSSTVSRRFSWLRTNLHTYPPGIAIA